MIFKALLILLNAFIIPFIFVWAMILGTKIQSQTDRGLLINEDMKCYHMLKSAQEMDGKL